MDLIANDPNLSKVSIRTYISRIRAMENAFNTNIDDIIHNPDTYIPIINKHYTELNTIKASVKTILAILQRLAHTLPEVKAQLRAAGIDPDAPLPPPRNRTHTTWPDPIRTIYNKWFRLFTEVDIVLLKRAHENQPTEKQAKAYMPLADVIAARDKQPRESVAFLLLSLYTMMEPVRADFQRIRIYHSNQEADNAAGAEPNFIVITENQITLTLNKYKTAKELGTFKRIIPKNLEAVIREDILRRPRDFLIVSPTTGAPYDDDKQYSKYVNRILKTALGKPIGVSMLRHIYVDALDYNAMTTGQKKKLARNMMHSFVVNDQYRLRFNAGTGQGVAPEEEKKTVSSALTLLPVSRLSRAEA